MQSSNIRQLKSSRNTILREIEKIFDEFNRDFLYEILRQWLYTTLKILPSNYNSKEKQIQLLFFHDQLLKLIDASYFLLQADHPEEMFSTNFRNNLNIHSTQKHLVLDKTNWVDTITDFFKHFKLDQAKAALWEWLSAPMVWDKDEYDQADKGILTRAFENLKMLLQATYGLFLIEELQKNNSTTSSGNTSN